MKRKIHILGASGSGTTTLGAGLAQELGIHHLDTDDFFWKKTAIPFSEKEPADERLRNLQREIDRLDEWVLSGSLCGWGDALMERFTHVIFLWVPWEVRKDRLLRREEARYGLDLLQPGGDMHQIHTAFMAWASRYDSAGFEQRSRTVHDEWLQRLPGSSNVIRLEGIIRQSDLLDRARDAIASNQIRHPPPKG